MRPIDADALNFEVLKHEPYPELTAKEIVDDAPTLTLNDIVPPGRWIKHEGYDECNLCHTKTIYGSNYCRNCGAKMDLELIK